jgi:hypothetical protein
VGGDGKVALALDSITADGTIAKIAQVLRPDGAVALLLPVKVGDNVAVGDAGMLDAIPNERNPFPKETKIAYVRTFMYRGVCPMFSVCRNVANVFFLERIFER